MPLLGPGFEDVAEHDGKLYTNKAPALSFLAVPAYLAARAAVGPPSPENLRVTLNEMRLLCATIPLLALAIVFFALARRFGADPLRRNVLLLEVLFATPLFAYGLLFFSHAFVALALFAGWALMFVQETSRRTALVLAGALFGMAVASEYTAAVPVLFLVASSWERKRPWNLMLVVAGGIPFAVALALYHLAAFGGFLQLPSGHETNEQFRTMAQGGVFGIGLPSFRILLQLLFHPSKGLLVFSPFLVLVGDAWRQSFRKLPRRAWVSMIAVPLSIILLHAGYPNWHGGWTVGARYLVPALPFVIFPFLFRRVTRLELFLVGVSIAFVVPTTLVFPFVPTEIPMPWISLSGWLLRKGLVIPNLFHFLWRPLAIAVPFGLVAAAAFVATRGRRAAVLGAGVAAAWVVTILISVAVPAGRVVRIERAYTREMYFDQQGTIDKEFAGERLPDSIAARRMIERRKPPTSWTF
jgi:hypothetical protein